MNSQVQLQIRLNLIQDINSTGYSMFLPEQISAVEKLLVESAQDASLPSILNAAMFCAENADILSRYSELQEVFEQLAGKLDFNAFKSVAQLSVMCRLIDIAKDEERDALIEILKQFGIGGMNSLIRNTEVLNAIESYKPLLTDRQKEYTKVFLGDWSSIYSQDQPIIGKTASAETLPVLLRIRQALIAAAPDDFRDRLGRIKWLRRMLGLPARATN